MLKSISISSLVLLASLGIAAAQQKANDPGQQAPANPQGDGAVQVAAGRQGGAGLAPRRSRDQHRCLCRRQARRAGRAGRQPDRPVEGLRAQCALDAMPTMALPLVLTDEQKQRILASVARRSPVAQIDAKPADMLPADDGSGRASRRVKAAIPMMSDFGIIRTSDKILLVRAPNMVVTGEIRRIIPASRKSRLRPKRWLSAATQALARIAPAALAKGRGDADDPHHTRRRICACWRNTPPHRCLPDALKELAPTGKLRAAINYGNSVLAQKGPDGEPRGVSADLSRELAKRLGVPLEYVTFTAAGKAFEAAKENKIDVLFVAIEPVRAAEVEFTPPYVLIEGAYLVLKDSPAARAGRPRPARQAHRGRREFGLRPLPHAHAEAREAARAPKAAAARTSTCSAPRSSTPRRACASRSPNTRSSIADVRVMEKPFQQIRQAMGTPKGRTAAAAYLRTFIEEMKANGFVADALKRSNQGDAQVAPAGG